MSLLCVALHNVNNSEGGAFLSHLSGRDLLFNGNAHDIALNFKTNIKGLMCFFCCDKPWFLELLFICENNSNMENWPKHTQLILNFGANDQDCDSLEN